MCSSDLGSWTHAASCASDAEDAAWVQLPDLARYVVAPVTVSVIHKAASRGFDTGDRPLVW